MEYEGEHAATFYLDLFPENQVVVEVKAFSHQLTNDELAQVINYLKATGAPVALLFNFGRRRLEYRRVFPGRDVKPVQRIGRDNAIDLLHKSKIFIFFVRTLENVRLHKLLFCVEVRSLAHFCKRFNKEVKRSGLQRKVGNMGYFTPKPPTNESAGA